MIAWLEQEVREIEPDAFVWSDPGPLSMGASSRRGSLYCRGRMGVRGCSIARPAVFASPRVASRRDASPSAGRNLN